MSIRRKESPPLISQHIKESVYSKHEEAVESKKILNLHVAKNPREKVC